MIDLCLRAGLILRVVTPHHEYRRSLTELVRSVSCRPTRLRSKPAPRRGSSLSTMTKRTSGKRRKSNLRRKPSRATGQARGSRGNLGQEFTSAQPARLTPKCPFFYVQGSVDHNHPRAKQPVRPPRGRRRPGPKLLLEKRNVSPRKETIPKTLIPS